MTQSVDITVPATVTAMAQALASSGHDAILVGGSVRDALLGTSSTDIDLVTDATPDQVRELASEAEWARSTYAVGERFGTLGVVLADGTLVEVSRYREPALVLATAEGRFSADARLRDFTVNALGYNLITGELLDPVGGAADIEASILRAPVDAAQRFAEDPLRVVRACRFASELDFKVEPATRAAMSDFATRISAVAAERVRDELTKLLVGRNAEKGLRLALTTGVLAVVLPEVAALDGVTQPSFHDLDVLAHTFQTVAASPATASIRWAALLHDVGKAPARSVDPDGRIRFIGHAQVGRDMTEQICERLRISNANTRAIVHLVAEHMRLGELDTHNDRAVDRAVRKLDLWDGNPEATAPLVSAEDVLELTLADFSATAHRADAPKVRRALGEAIARSRARGTHREIVAPVSGTELMAELGLDEGVEVGAAKRAIETAIETGEIPQSDKEGALNVARAAVAHLREGSD